jgi:hypothetical protein
MRPSSFLSVLSVLGLPLVLACTAPTTAPSTPPCSGEECPNLPLSGAKTLATDTYVSGEIAVTSTAVYWVDRDPTITDTIRTTSLAGGSGATFYSVTPDPSAAIENIAVDEANVYWTEAIQNGDSYLKAQSQEGGAPVVLASNAEPLIFVGVTGAFVYFGSLTEVRRVPTLGAAPVDDGGASPGPSPTNDGASTSWISAFAANGQGACWMEIATHGDAASTTLLLCESDWASQPIVIGTLPTVMPRAMAMNATDVFCATDDGVFVAPITGGTVTFRATVTSRVLALAADDDSLYWIGAQESEGLQKMSLAGGAPETVAIGLETASGSLTAGLGIAQSGTALYWTDGRGLVLSASK